MHPVALAARERAHLLLLVRALEVEGPTIGARIDLALAKRQHVEASGNFLPHCTFAVESVSRLVHMAELARLADLDGAPVGLLRTSDHAEKRGLAGAVRTDDADDTARRQLEGEIVDQQVVAESLRKLLEIDHVLAEPLRHRDDDLGGGWPLLGGLGKQLIVALVTRLGLGLASARARGDPLLLARKRFLAGFFLPTLLFPALALLPQPGWVIALVRGSAAAREVPAPH